MITDAKSAEKVLEEVIPDSYDLARLLVDMVETEKYGIYHATNEGGYISWYDFTKEIFRQAGYGTKSALIGYNLEIPPSKFLYRLCRNDMLF